MKYKLTFKSDSSNDFVQIWIFYINQDIDVKI